LSDLKSTFALLVFIGMDFHHALLRLVAGSFEILPLAALAPRAGALGRSVGDLATEQGGLVFSLGAQMAMPVTVVLLLVTVALAFLARAVPEVNVFTLGFIVKLGLGLWIVFLIFPLLKGTYVELFARAQEEAVAFLRQLARGA
jgi:flagellar biosynthetic protein FliR